MRLSENYLFQLEKRLANWQNKSELQITRKKLLAHVDAGYFRARIRIKNGDLLEVSEYVVKQGEELAVISYSYHWQDSDGQVKKRWDNAPHHPHVKNYPFHLHDGSEQNIHEAESMTLQKAMNFIDNELK